MNATSSGGKLGRDSTNRLSHRGIARECARSESAV